MMRWSVREVEFYLRKAATRIPFRFGMSTFRWGLIVLARLRAEDQAGKSSEGFSSDLMVPKWFDKNPAKSADDNARDLLESARKAAAVMTSGEGKPLPLFELWHRTYQARLYEDRTDSAEPLVRGFGVALLERALLDAACRAAEVPFFTALKKNLFGFDAGGVHPELKDWNLAESLPARPLDAVQVRHTVGMEDPLRSSEIPDAERLNDGFPQALDEAVARNGLTCFKIKLSGEVEQDRERLLAVAAVLEEGVRGNLLVTLDANEQYKDLGGLVRLCEMLEAHPRGRRLLRAVLCFEQPLSRFDTFDGEATLPLREARLPAPVMIDEADCDLEAFKKAVACGYHGVSVKNCKGVFRSFLNRGLCAIYSDKEKKKYFQLAEDLGNLPVLPLHQDLATLAAHGLTHAERNGHHYFRGLDHLPEEEARSVLAAHPDLYRESPGGKETPGGIALRIEKGTLNIGSIQTPGYGYGGRIWFENRTPAAEWEFGKS